MHLEELFKAGMLATSTVGEPGAQGAATAGVQGIGVRTPKAAAVADATAGLAMELHIPKGAMFKKGLLSIMLAIGVAVVVRLTGSTFSIPGAMPNEHCRAAPPHTS